MSADESIDKDTIEKLSQISVDIKNELSKVIIGQDHVVRQLLITIFSGAHCLIEGVPGLAKTLLIKTLGKVLGINYARIQFTPDLMPSDITGTEIIEEDKATGKRFFRFIKGPIFTNLLLADEINRTPPKTQASLLQAMQEKAVTAGGDTHILDAPFFVMATQNPVDQEGTYPLPEAQLDRFMFRIFINYPSYEEEREITKRSTDGSTQELKTILTQEELANIPCLIKQMPVSEHIIKYAVKLVRKTRPQEDGSPDFIKEWVNWGAGPRAAQYLVMGAKVNAVLRGSYNVSAMDVRSVANSVLNHRIITNFNAEAEGIDSQKIIQKLIDFIQE